VMSWPVILVFVNGGLLYLQNTELVMLVKS
jgi:hypothetical protein